MSQEITLTSAEQLAAKLGTSVEKAQSSINQQMKARERQKATLAIQKDARKAMRELGI